MPSNIVSSDLTRFKKNKAIAVYKAANQLGVDGGIKSLPQSTRLSAIQGFQPVNYYQNGHFVDVSGCCCVAPTSSEVSVISIETPQPPYDASYNIYFTVSWSPFPGASEYQIVTDYPKDYLVVFTSPTEANVYLANFSGETIVYTVTATNTCGSVDVSGTTQPCFLAGSLVMLADGTSKAIEDIRVGDVVLGAFGEHNPVLALHYSQLGDGTMMNINNEHHSTTNHPHVSIDKQFFTLYPSATSTRTYGREHTVINADGQLEKRVLHGLRSDRIKQLTTGIVLKTVEGGRLVSSLEEYSLPPETPLYNLVVGGSHTYHVDGYAVTGWPREDDFDYDAWAPKA